MVEILYAKIQKQKAESERLQKIALELEEKTQLQLQQIINTYE